MPLARPPACAAALLLKPEDERVLGVQRAVHAVSRLQAALVGDQAEISALWALTALHPRSLRVSSCRSARSVTRGRAAGRAMLLLREEPRLLTSQR